MQTEMLRSIGIIIVFSNTGRLDKSRVESTPDGKNSRGFGTNGAWCLARSNARRTFDLPSKKRGGAFLLIGFMALGGFVVERGFIAEGRV